MRLLFIGDIFGEPGMRAVALHLPDIRHDYDYVIANGENCAAGKGLSRQAYKRLREAGVDLVTLGNHAWDQREVHDLLAREPVIRALNYPPGTPGRGWWRLGDLLVAQVMGRVFMNPLDDPFRAIDALLAEQGAGPSLVEIHAEATSEKAALGMYLDGRVSAVLGTHTHIPTADARLLPRGTAFQTDVGMSGTYRSVIGGDYETFLQRFLTQRSHPFRPAEGPAEMRAAQITLEGNRAVRIEPYRWEEPRVE